MTQSRFRHLFEEIRRRRVFRVATLYVVSLWPVIQIVDILSPALNISDTTYKNILLYFVLGFPVAIIMAWIYNLTPRGLVKNTGNEEAADERLIGNGLELAVIVFCLIIATVLFTFQEHLFDIPADQTRETTQGVMAGQTYESIAVLPFVPFSEDRQDEFFADGLAEELLNVLAKIQSIRVAARTSSFAYKGVQRNIKKIGSDLGVDVILEGSVRRNDVDNTVRVTAQLIDVRSGTHIWSETYDRKYQDIFKIQDEITEAVVAELKIALLGGQRQQLLAHETASPEAMIAHAQGRTELAKRTASSVERAKELFLKAVDLDAHYATAYASLAESHILLVEYAGADREQHIRLAQMAVDKALEIDPQLGLAWAAQGLVYYASEDKREEAITALKKAIELNPSYAMAYMWYGSLQDDFQESTRLYQKAFQLDPKSPVAGFNLANNLINLGRDAEAMETFTKMVDADPFYPNAYFLVGEINLVNGRLDQAIESFRRSYDLGDVGKSALVLAQLYVNLGEIEQSRYWLDQVPENYVMFERDITWLNIMLSAQSGDWGAAKARLREVASIDKTDKLSDQMDAIIASYFLGDFEGTVKTFESISKSSWDDLPESKKGLFFAHLTYVAYAYSRLDNQQQSLAIAARARQLRDKRLELGFRIKPQDRYQLALLEMVEGNTELAMVSLQNAVDLGWADPWQLLHEPILKDVQEHKMFQDVRQSLQTRVRILKEKLAYADKITQI